MFLSIARRRQSSSFSGTNLLKIGFIAGISALLLLLASCSSTSMQGGSSGSHSSSGSGNGGNTGSSGTTGGSGGGESSSSGIKVQVSPASAEVQSGKTLQLTATLTGTSQTAVTWKAGSGSITASGLFTAPSVTSQIQVQITATSAANSSATGSGTITVYPAATSKNLTITTSSLSPAIQGYVYNATLTASGGTAPYSWSASGFPAGMSVGAAGKVTGSPTQNGSFPVQIQVEDSQSHKATWSPTMDVNPNTTSSNYDGPAELPLVYLQTAMADTPAPGSTISVPGNGSLQSALNSANCGDTITLQAGATYTGIVTFPAKSCDDQHWIIVRTSTPDSGLPPEGTRITPCYAGVSSLPGRPALNCSSTQNVLAKLQFASTGNGPIQFANGASHYRLIGLEITRQAGTGLVGALILAKSASAADSLIIDRSWIHGTSQDDTATGVALSGFTNTAVISSYLNDFHCTAIVGACIDSHAIGGGAGSLTGGPYAILNNFLEAAGENILFGGSAATSTPADIQISQNHFFKPLTWMKGSAGFVGGSGGHPFVAKNHLELKNAQRVLAENNIYEYSWGGFTQNGHSILLTPKDQYNGNTNGNICPLCKVTDVTIRYSTISHVGGGIAMGTSVSDGGGQASAGERYSIHDVIIDDINGPAYDGGGGFLEYANGWNTNVINSVTVNHVTAFPTGHLMVLWNETSNPPMWGFTFTNNIVNATSSPFLNGDGNPTSCAVSDIPLTSLTNCYTSYSYNNNVIEGALAAHPASDWPSGNFFPTSDKAIQFTNYNNGNGGNYQLLSTSPYKNAGTDGKDLGADVEAVEAAIANVY